MKILLLQPPVQDFYDTDVRLQPLGLGSLKAALALHFPDIEITVRDFHRGFGRSTVRLPDELRYLRDFYPFKDRSPFSTFHQYYHFGASFDHIAREVEQAAPTLIGISSLFSPYYREVLQCAAAIRERIDCPIVVGGSHASALPESLLASEHIDYVIRGEGEDALVSLVRSLLEGTSLDDVPGLAFERDGEVQLNPLGPPPDLDTLPPPDLSDLDPGDYLFQGRKMAFVVTSRSCPHRCSFCSVHTTFGHRYRRRSPARVLEEIERRYEEGYRVIDFEDDNLTYYREEMIELCELLIDRFATDELQLLALNGISYLSLDPELLTLMKKAGFTHLNLSLVSSDQSVLKTSKRPHTVERFQDVVRAAFDLDFDIVSYQILGLPHESLESMIGTMVFLARLPVLQGASPFYLTPRSPIAAQFPPRTESDILKARLTAMAIETDFVNREDLYTLFVSTRILNFLKSLRLPLHVKLSLQEALIQLENRCERDRVGVRLFRHLLEYRELRGESPQGERPLPKFRFEVFEQVWQQLGAIASLGGGQIEGLTPSPPSKNTRDEELLAS